MAKSKIQDMNVHHRNLDIMMKYVGGFAPTWMVSVRWPGFKNRKYFTSVPAWNRLPSKAIDLVFEKIDVEMGLAYIDITTADFGTHRYQVRSITNEGNYILKEKSLCNNWLRFNPKEGRVEMNSPSQDNKWDVYISDSAIVQVDFWNKG